MGSGLSRSVVTRTGHCCHHTTRTRSAKFRAPRYEARIKKDTEAGVDLALPDTWAQRTGLGQFQLALKVGRGGLRSGFQGTFAVRILR